MMVQLKKKTQKKIYYKPIKNILFDNFVLIGFYIPYNTIQVLLAHSFGKASERDCKGKMPGV